MEKKGTKRTRRQSDKPWKCKLLNLDGKPCGVTNKGYADHVRHSNATTIHLNGKLNFGYMCTVCDKNPYFDAAYNNVYDHIRKKHPQHGNKTTPQLKELVNIIKRRKSKVAAPELQEEGAWKCPQEDCGRSYRSEENLNYHLARGHSD